MIINKYGRNLAVLVLVSALGHAFIGHAVSYSPIPTEREEKTGGIRRKGETVCLFQSGTADVRKEMHINDLLVVYREAENQQFIVVGKIKVLSFAGADYLKAEVVEGEVMTGDIAKKGDVASLVLSPADRCE